MKEELKNVIKTLFSLQTQIHFLVETLNTTEQNEKYLNKIELNDFFQKQTTFQASVHTILSNFAIIIFCSFLEEYHKYFTHSFIGVDFKDRIIRVKKKNKPGISRINKWKDIYDFRNQLVAHNYRIKGKSFFSDKTDYIKFKIPNTLSEKNLFSGIVYLICLNIKTEFPDIAYSIKPREKMLDNFFILSENVDNEKELTELIEIMI